MHIDPARAEDYEANKRLDVGLILVRFPAISRVVLKGFELLWGDAYCVSYYSKFMREEEEEKL